MPSSFINPSSLSTPSPAPSTPASESDAGPSRKRARTESSSEERKEARAHRNRIAAQNSRDRRKAQFSFLEQKVAELEEENRQLRAGMGVTTASRAEEQQAAERKERERENEELKERIKTLERGWDAVMKAIASGGLPTGTPIASQESASATSSHQPPATPQSNSSSASSSPTPPIKPASTSFPVLSAPISFPLSPAPSHNSLDFDLDLSPSASSLFSISDEFASMPASPEPNTGGDHRGTSPLDVPAAGGLTFSLSLPDVGSPAQQHLFTVSEQQSALDDAIMEDLFREILAPSPSHSTSNLPLDPSSLSHEAGTPAPAAPSAAAQVSLILGSDETPNTGAAGDESREELDVSSAMNWTSDENMQRILDLLPAAAAVALEGGEGSLPLSELDLGWELENFGNVGTVGVF